MYSTPEEIDAAVAAYRSHISNRNRRAVQVYVSLVSDADFEEGDDEGDEDINDVRIQSLWPIFDNRLGTFVSTPSQILTRWDELCSIYDMDGTGGRVPSEEEKALLEDYFLAMEQDLKRSCREEVRQTIKFPEEFRLLAKQVQALTGPGMTEYKSKYQASFWTGPWIPTAETENHLPNIIKSPEWLEENVVSFCWDVAAGWESGVGYDCWSYVVYCRRAAENDEASACAEPWAWRYMLNDIYGQEVFNTIPELLAWYYRYRERSLPDASSMTGYEILTGKVLS
ncbi:hypothetical protein GCG54_00008584 [Colletotrichum gloeosporioides]|uniref:Uncharacterized protein n=1 Tax=Colletotrichum gloeosporioides TaxID=474922 RepID=A0A8H4FLJ0_COLGL|nr:uncharacterized protein GCG54_00008584 [Colletotrichum gloeosporioides]KAF3805354.1 hypothetical protein GCG54_00008584 [Colletotrichum gloeosporioides]